MVNVNELVEANWEKVEKALKKGYTEMYGYSRNCGWEYKVYIDEDGEIHTLMDIGSCYLRAREGWPELYWVATIEGWDKDTYGIKTRDINKYINDAHMMLFGYDAYGLDFELGA